MAARYNTRQQVFPLNLVATGLGFQPAEFFQMDAGERAVPQVDLSGRESP